MISKAVMKNSTDSIRGTDKKAEVLWKEVWKVYVIFVEKYNKLYSEKMPDDFARISDRTECSVKSQWNTKIQPCINKFAAICATYPPKSGQLEDDKLMDLYYREVKKTYEERAEKNKALPKTMDNYFSSYMWLKKQPRFECLFSSDDKNPGKRPAQKKPRTKGRDTSKRKMASENAVEHIKKKVSSALKDFVPNDSKTPTSVDNERWGVIKDGFKSITTVTHQLMMNQVMREAPLVQKTAYFDALRSTAMNEAELKNQSTELKKHEAILKKQTMELQKEKLELERMKVRSQINKLKAAENSVREESDSEENQDTYDNSDLSKCNWPNCDMLGLAAVLCNVCNKQHLHHCCQAEAEFDIGLCGEECKLICYSCHNAFKKNQCAI